MANSRSEEEIVRDVLRRLDKDGELAKSTEGFESMVSSAFGRLLLKAAHIEASEVEQLLKTGRKSLSDIARSIMLFAPIGWAPSGFNHEPTITAALETYDATASLDAAEKALVEGWNQSGMFRFCHTRLLGLAPDDDEMREFSHKRADLIEKALAHHNAGAFEASVPIVLAQVDGIVLDMTEGRNGFFYRPGDLAHLRDNDTVSGTDEGLSSLQRYFGITQNSTGTSGLLSRHGILHGRELGYDTRTNSTKCFVLLLAIVEWAQPKARQLVDRRRAEREAQFAGVEGVDDEGRRLDRRGFRDVRMALNDLWFDQLMQFHLTGRYELTPKPSSKRTQEQHARLKQLSVVCAQDGRQFGAWRATPSGWILGVGAVAGTTAATSIQKYYAGPTEPPADISREPWQEALPPDFY
jgi:hypothetical protein